MIAIDILCLRESNSGDMILKLQHCKLFGYQEIDYIVKREKYTGTISYTEVDENTNDFVIMKRT